MRAVCNSLYISKSLTVTRFYDILSTPTGRLDNSLLIYKEYLIFGQVWKEVHQIKITNIFYFNNGHGCFSSHELFLGVQTLGSFLSA